MNFIRAYRNECGAAFGAFVVLLLSLIFVSEWNRVSYIRFDTCIADVCPEIGTPIYLNGKIISKIKSVQHAGKWDVVAFRSKLKGICGNAFFEIGSSGGRRVVIDTNGKNVCSDTIRGARYLMIKDASVISPIIGKFRDLSRMYSACAGKYEAPAGEVCDGTNDFCAEFSKREHEYVENAALNSRNKDSVYVNFALQRLVDKGEANLANENVPRHSAEIEKTNIEVRPIKVFFVKSCNELVDDREGMSVVPAFDYCVTFSSVVCNFRRTKCAVVAEFYANADNRNTYVLDVSKCGSTYCIGRKSLVSKDMEIHTFDCKSWTRGYEVHPWARQEIFPLPSH